MTATNALSSSITSDLVVHGINVVSALEKSESAIIDMVRLIENSEECPAAIKTIRAILDSALSDVRDIAAEMFALNDLSSELTPIGSIPIVVNVPADPHVIENKPLVVTAAWVCQRLYEMADGGSLIVKPSGSMYHSVTYSENIDPSVACAKEFVGLVHAHDVKEIVQMATEANIGHVSQSAGRDLIRFSPWVMREVTSLAEVERIASEVQHGDIAILRGRKPDEVILGLVDFRGSTSEFLSQDDECFANLQLLPEYPSHEVVLPFARMSADVWREVGNADFMYVECLERGTQGDIMVITLI